MAQSRFPWAVVVLAVMAAFLFTVGASVEQLVPDGDQFQVNTTIQGNQFAPRVAMTSDGFMVVWESDGPSSGVFGQVFDPTGSQIGSEIAVNQTGSGDLSRPAVGGVPSSGFLVAWEHESSYSVIGRKIATDGSPVGNEIQVSEASSDELRGVRVAGNPHGGFVVVWTRYLPSIPGGETEGRALASDGQPTGGEFFVGRGGYYSWSEVSMGGFDDHDRFVVSWYDDQSYFGYWQVHTRRMTATGQGVSSSTCWDADSPTVAVRPNGAFVVAMDYMYDDVLRRYNRDHREFRNWNPVEVDEIPKAIEVSPRGDVVMVSHDGTQITAQVMTAEGVMQDEVPVSDLSFATGGPQIASVGNTFAVVWTSAGSAGSDDDGTSIQARRFIRPKIMGDDFSGGGLNAWSSSSPAGCYVSRTLSCGWSNADVWSNAFGGSTNVESSYACLVNQHPGAEVAYAFTAPTTGQYTIDLLGTTANLGLAVIDGEECIPANCIEGAEGTGSGDRTVVFSATAGQAFTVVVDGRAGQFSEYEIRAECP